MIHPVEIKHVDHAGGMTYYTAIDDLLYYNNDEKIETYCMKNNVLHTVFHHTCLSHNFTIFKQGNIYYGIGGQDRWKVDKKWRNINFEQFKVLYEEHFDKPYIRGEDFYEAIKFRFDTTRILSHCRGLYLLKSEDGINWKFVQDNPIITIKNKGFISALEWKSAEFDAKPCIMRFQDKWFLYLRANTNKDERKIQFATSEDLINWSKFKLVDFDNDVFHNGDNYYHPVMFEYKHRLIGFFNFYNKLNSFIKIKYSLDGEKWFHMDEMFIEKAVKLDEGKYKCASVVDSIINNDRSAFLFVNHNYNLHDNNFKSYVVNYKIPLEQLNDRLNEIL